MTNFGENYEERITNIVNISQLHKHLDSPHLVRLDLPTAIKKMPFDVGSFAYAKRDTSVNRTTKDMPQKVVLSSLKPERKGFLIALYDYFVIKGWNENTVLAYLTKFRMIFDFCDSNNHSDFIESGYAFAKAYAAYTDFLFEQIHLRALKPQSAREMQKKMEDMALIWKGSNDMYKICANVTEIKVVREEAEAPDEDIVKNAVRTFYYIAHQYGQAVVQLKPFPWLLEMPDYKTYVYPTNINPLKTPFTQYLSSYCYDYETGKKLTIEQYAENGAKGDRRSLNSSLNKVWKNIETINDEGITNYYRQTNATMAMAAYLQLFIYMTGAYPSEVAQIEVGAELDIDRYILNNSFRAVKFRANGNPVLYNLGEKIGLQILKEYLNLRKLVLDGRECSYLFFQLGRGETKDAIKQHDERTIRKIFSRTDCVFFEAKTPTVTARDIRKYKSVILHELRQHVEKIAKNLNHQPKTNLKSYIPANPTKMKNEWGSHWDAVHAAAKRIPILDIEQSKSEDISIPTGHCSDKNNPESIRGSVPVEPDCKKQYGCLFCNKYLIHADRTDAHKLLSVKFVIEQVLFLVNEEDKAEELLREIVVRIDYLIDRLKGFNESIKKIIEDLFVDVFEYGELTQFWLYRIRRYEQMGVM